MAWHNKSLERNPNVPAALTFEVDISGLERHFKLLETLSIDNIDEGFTRLEGEAQEAARRLIDKQIYDTPERGYERTGKLKQSIYAFKKRTQEHLAVDSRRVRWCWRSPVRPVQRAGYVRSPREFGQHPESSPGSASRPDCSRVRQSRVWFGATPVRDSHGSAGS